MLVVTDANGSATGEVLLIQSQSGVYPVFDRQSSCVMFGNDYERGFNRLRQPRRGDRIIFERGSARGKLSCVATWTFAELWEAEQPQHHGQDESEPRMPLVAYTNFRLSSWR
jgi:hypothetical protein